MPAEVYLLVEAQHRGGHFLESGPCGGHFVESTKVLKDRTAGAHKPRGESTGDGSTENREGSS